MCKCKEIKPENSEHFYLMQRKYRDRTYPEFDTRCIVCAKQKVAKYAEKNKSKIAARQKSEQARQRQRETHRIRMQNPEYRARQLETGRRSKAKHREHINAQRRTPEGRAKRRAETKKRLTNDPVYRMRMNISNAVLKALRKGKTSKAGKSILQYLGYTILELKTHIEAQFDANMSWSNYGIYWHVDHIVPQSDLPYLSMEDENFKQCWALKNLRPLEARQNICEGARRTRHRK